MNERRPDFELLREFIRRGDQEAFATIVRRHVDLVYATALRKTELEPAAEEIAQNVFAALARKAWRFAPGDSLPSWLYRAALLEAKGWLRGEIRRRRREQTAAEMGTTMKTPDEQTAFRALVPLLDEALLSLRETDRTALLLRFYESRSLREVGAALAVSEDAAQKRVAGALEQLERFYRSRGFRTATVSATVAALEHTSASASAATVHIVVNTALQAAPPALAGASAWLARIVGLTKAQKALVAVVLLSVPVIWHWRATPRAEPVAAAPQEERTATPTPDWPRAMAMAPANPGPEAAAVPATGASAVITPLRAEGPDSIHVTGLIDLPDCRVALLDIYFRTAFRSNVVVRTNHLILKEGQSYEQEPFKGGRLIFELEHLDLETGRIQARENGQDTQFTVIGPDEGWSAGNMRPGDKPTIGLRGADFADVLDLYGQLLGRTILCHPGVKRSPLNLVSAAASRVAAARMLEEVLKEGGVASLPLGERFELVVPANKARSIVKIAGPPPPPTEPGATTIPAGVIRLEDVPWSKVLGLYGELVGRRWEQGNLPPGNLFFFHNQTPLTQAEILYAFETMFGWQGFKAVPSGGESFRLRRTRKP